MVRSAIRQISAILKPSGRKSSAALAASGLSIALMPQRSGEALHLVASSPRGLAEVRAGLGGTYAALGLWALARGSSEANTAVGVTWLGAASLRAYSLAVDKPDTDWTFWAYLMGEVTLGVGAVVAAARA